MPTVRKARQRDAKQLSKRLRLSDVEEIYATTGLNAESELSRAFKAPSPKKIFAIDDDRGKVIALFGVSPNTYNPAVGVPWLLCSDALIRDHWRVFVKQSSHWIQELSVGYEYLENFVYSKNTAHIKWLRWCGFSVDKQTVGFGVRKAPFHRFEYRTNTNSSNTTFSRAET